MQTRARPPPVGHYIKERTRDAQFVIISLRNNMFELADRLVGIYKTENATKTVTINPGAESEGGGRRPGGSAWFWGCMWVCACVRLCVSACVSQGAERCAAPRGPVVPRLAHPPTHPLEPPPARAAEFVVGGGGGRDDGRGAADQEEGAGAAAGRGRAALARPVPMEV
jgi:hypothetical protein